MFSLTIKCQANAEFLSEHFNCKLVFHVWFDIKQTALIDENLTN